MVATIDEQAMISADTQLVSSSLPDGDVVISELDEWGILRAQPGRRTRMGVDPKTNPGYRSDQRPNERV